MKTIKEVSQLVGISVRTLQYYDRIGLLKPKERSQAGYRLYDEEDLRLLQQILLFKALEFPLKEIKAIMASPSYDQQVALQQQIDLLTLKKEHLENLIVFAQGLKLLGVNYMDLKVFDTQKIDEYAERAKEYWGKTPAYQEYQERQKSRTRQEDEFAGQQIMDVFVKMGKIKSDDPKGDQAQALVKELQDLITANFYTCTNDILLGLGQMYAGGGEFTTNIDQAGGQGTAIFVKEAIEYYCQAKDEN
ncbi:MerR family transcriptional regulator [Vaginisenegalia massiliensis]|uniref:MerR family transcriptional regulator n=1 Tax=Vaginisenegalia massiliensis TaxID=2058294 RepID=UPI000F52269B|nr:MerR family transcriptional regulator [Vaginisenegalia massiliensis]